MSKAPKTLTIKSLPSSLKKASTLKPSTLAAIVKKARADVGVKHVAKLRKSDTASGSGHITFASKSKVA